MQFGLKTIGQCFAPIINWALVKLCVLFRETLLRIDIHCCVLRASLPWCAPPFLQLPSPLSSDHCYCCCLGYRNCWLSFWYSYSFLSSNKGTIFHSFSLDTIVLIFQLDFWSWYFYACPICMLTLGAYTFAVSVYGILMSKKESRLVHLHPFLKLSIIIYLL